MPGLDLRINAGAEADKASTFIAKVVARASAGGAIVALSGGVDSAVVGALCVRALGKGKVLGLLLPSEHTPAGDTEDARSLAAGWGIRTITVPISRSVKAVKQGIEMGGTKLARANLEARVRMVISYYFANTLGYLVAGTGDRSEELVGFFTKFGDGGIDFLPIAHLYKTQVRQLGGHLGLPRKVVEKPASPQLWPGHRASDELPADYDKLDPLLHLMFDLKMKPGAAAAKVGVPEAVALRALEMHRRTRHKRELPPSLV